MSLELKKVCYSYSVGTSYEVQALKDISLMIPDGQLIGMMVGQYACKFLLAAIDTPFFYLMTRKARSEAF